VSFIRTKFQEFKAMKYLKLTLIALLTAGIAGCFPDNSRIFDGPLQVEFRPVSAEQRMSNGNTYDANVQLIGPHQDSDIIVNFEIDTENSTAVEGVHFEVDGRSAVLPANSSFAAITVTAIEENIDDTRPVLVITLLGDDSGEIIAAQNYKTLTLTLRP
jgi:hypothetical protein